MVRLFLDFKNPYTIKKFIAICSQESEKQNSDITYLISISKSIRDDFKIFCDTNDMHSVYLNYLNDLVRNLKIKSK